MLNDLDLLNSHLYIFKRLQREKIREYGWRLSGKVLDIGCGKKPYKRFLTSATEYIGADSDDNVKPDILCSVEKIKAKDSEYDGVLCSEVIEHVKEPKVALKEIARVMKKGGLLYLTVPMSWCLHYEPSDFWRYTPYSLKYLLGDAGFEILEMERLGGICSLVSQRLIDVGYFFFLRTKIPKPLILMLLAPFSLISFYLAKVFDKVDKRDALGWVVLARKN